MICKDYPIFTVCFFGFSGSSLGTLTERIPSLKLAEILSPSNNSPNSNERLNEDSFNSLRRTLAPSLSKALCLSPEIVRIPSSTSTFNCFLLSPGISATIPILSSYSYTLTFGYAVLPYGLTPTCFTISGNCDYTIASNILSKGVRNSSLLKKGIFVRNATLVILFLLLVTLVNY